MFGMNVFPFLVGVPWLFQGRDGPRVHLSNDSILHFTPTKELSTGLWTWVLVVLESRVSSHQLLTAGTCSLHGTVYTGEQQLILSSLVFPKEATFPQCVPH